MRPEDEGEYSCRAFNTAGETTTSAFLLQQGVYILHLLLLLLLLLLHQFSSLFSRTNWVSQYWKGKNEYGFE